MLPNGTERVVAPGSFTLMTKEEIEHITSIAPGLFVAEKMLRLEEREVSVELGFVQDETAPVFDEAFIKKQLNLSGAKMKVWLDTVTEPYLLEEIYNVVKTMDLSASKLNLLKEKMPEREFIGSGDAQ